MASDDNDNRSQPPLTEGEQKVLFGMFLRNYKKDLDDGITQRVLHKKLMEHTAHDDQRFNTVQETLSEHAERIAKVEQSANQLSQADLADRQAQHAAAWGSNGTGRFQAVPPAPQMAVPTPPMGMPAINIEVNGSDRSRSSSRRDSKGPLSGFTSETLKAVGKKIGPYIGVILVAWAGGHFVTAPAAQTRVVTVEVPASVAPPPATVAYAPAASASSAPAASTAPADAAPAPHPRH